VLFDEAMAGVPADGPRLAFGPDGLLYIALSQGVERPAGRPLVGRRRLSAARGRWPRRGGSAVFSYGDPWRRLAPAPACCGCAGGADGRATLLPSAPAGFGASSTPAPNPPFDVGVALFAGRAAVYGRGDRDAAPTVWVALPENESLWRATLAGASRTEVLLPHALGRIGDIVQATARLFVATRNRERGGTGRRRPTWWCASRLGRGDGLAARPACLGRQPQSLAREVCATV